MLLKHHMFLTYQETYYTFVLRKVGERSFFFEQELNSIIDIAKSPEAYNLKIRDKTPHSLNQKDLA
jgi:hypothetical protein